MSWSNIWKGLERINFEKEPFMWKFYEILLDGYDFKNKRVLEIGCGTGINSVLMAKKGAKVTFFDKSKEALKIVKKILDKFSLTGEFLQGDVFDFDLNKEFDLTHSEGVIEHFNNEKRREIVNIHADAVKKGGRVVIIVPNLKCPPYRLGKFLSEMLGIWMHGKEYPYTEIELKYRMELAGLKTEKIIGGEGLFSFGWLFAPVWLSTKNILEKSISFPSNNKIAKLNYNNFFANRWGRALGAVGERV